MLKKFRLSHKGMTMIEILVVIGLTSMLLIGAMSMLSAAVRLQSETLARQSMIDQASYVLDMMTKEMRMARKDYSGVCNVYLFDVNGAAISSIYATDDSKTSIWFLSQEKDNCMEIKYDSASHNVKMATYAIVEPDSFSDPIFDTNKKFPNGLPKYYPGARGGDPETYINLFSDDIIVERFVMSLHGSDGLLQPMVTISMTLKHRIKKNLAPVDIQTTISSRNLNWKPN